MINYIKNNVAIAFVAGIFGAMSWQIIASYLFVNVNKTDNLAQNTHIPVQQVKYMPVGANDFVDASRISTASVVFIKTTAEAQPSYSMFDLFFDGGGGQRQIAGSGSGVIFTEDGYIVTNNHVIENAQKIEVIHQKKSYVGKVIGTDPSADLAVIKIEGKGFPAIKRGSSKDLQVGEWVLAVGNPLNLTSTVTAGIVSAKGRDIQLISGQFPLESFIQTDAAINPGNSGGALVNAKGELVGINTAIMSRTGYYTGYGFAVPVDIVGKVFADLVKYKSVQKAFAGLQVADLNNELAKKYALNTENYEGAVVTQIDKNSEAQKAGLQEGDIILKVNQDAVMGKSNFEELLSYYRPSDKIRLSYKRNKQIKEINITLTNKEGTTEILKSLTYTSEIIGAEMEVISKIEKEKYDVPNGVRVLKSKKGVLRRIPEGFIILVINKKNVDTPQDVEKYLTEAQGRVIIEGISKEGERGYFSFAF